MYQQYFKLNALNRVITSVHIPAKIPICILGGDLFTQESIKHSNLEILQVGPNLFVGPTGNITDHIRHSCNPNCYLYIVGNRVILYSLYDILADSEITYDYSTSSTDSYESWSMNCNCQAHNCRKIISGIQYLNEDIIKEYKDKKMIPLFLLENIFR